MTVKELLEQVEQAAVALEEAKAASDQADKIAEAAYQAYQDAAATSNALSEQLRSWFGTMLPPATTRVRVS